MTRIRYKSMAIFITLALCWAFVIPGIALSKTQVLVSTQWLERHLGTPNLVVIDVRSASNYAFAHIPGALSLPYNKWQPMDEDKECQLMPSPEQFTELLQAIGVNKGSHVVIYDHGNTISDASKGATAYWIMKTMGHEQVSYLDGGFTKWTFEGRVVDNIQPTPKKGNFVAHFDSSKVATLKEVEKNLKTKKAIFLDTRNSGQHFGSEKRADIERYGHIPGSLNFPAPFMTNAGINRAPAVIKSREDLYEMAIGIGLPRDKGRPIIVYCNSAQFAGLGYLVLHDLLGYKNVKVFDGSMLEYCNEGEDLPLVRWSWGHVTQ